LLNKNLDHRNTETAAGFQDMTEREIQSAVGLGEVLKRIHQRLIAEGYIVKDGEIVPPSGNDAENT